MNQIKGVSTIVYDDEKDRLYFLLLKRTSNWHGYEFPKVKINDGEDIQTALTRIIKERVGIPGMLKAKKTEHKREFVCDNSHHCFDVFLVKANMNIPVNHSKEKHKSYIWTDAAGVLERLQWENEKLIFEKALEEIQG